MLQTVLVGIILGIDDLVHTHGARINFRQTNGLARKTSLDGVIQNAARTVGVRRWNGTHCMDHMLSIAWTWARDGFPERHGTKYRAEFFKTLYAVVLEGLLPLGRKTQKYSVKGWTLAASLSSVLALRQLATFQKKKKSCGS